MEQKQKKFLELVKSEIQDKNENLTKIPNIWNTEVKDLLYVVWLTDIEPGKKTGLSFDPDFPISQETKQKVIDLLDKVNSPW